MTFTEFYGEGPLRFRFLIFGYDRLAQFQVIAGDMTSLTEKARTKIKKLAEEVANQSAPDQLPTGLHAPLGAGHCVILGIPISATEIHSNRSGIKVVIVLHATTHKKLHASELLSMWRILEVSLSKAVGGGREMSLCASAHRLGNRLQIGLNRTERDELKTSINAASTAATMTQGSAVATWTYPIDFIAGNILAVLAEGARTRACKQLSFYWPYGTASSFKTSKVTACYFGSVGAYVSSPVRRREKTFGIR